MHQIINRIKDIFCIRVAEVIAVGAVSRTVCFCRQRFRLGIKVIVTVLFFEDLLHHIGSCPPGDVFIKEKDLVRLFERFCDEVVQVEGK